MFDLGLTSTMEYNQSEGHLIAKTFMKFRDNSYFKFQRGKPILACRHHRPPCATWHAFTPRAPACTTCKAQWSE